MDDSTNMILQEIADSLFCMDSTNPIIKLRNKNFEDRTLWLDLEIGIDAYEYAKQIVRWNIEDKNIPIEKRKPIRLYFFNFGGSEAICNMIVDIIKASKTPVYGYNMGTCASAAFWIFIVCHKRYMMEDATVLIHDGTVSVEGTGHKAIDSMREYEKVLKKMFNKIIANTKIDEKTLEEKFKDEWSISSDECLKYGICDKIIESLDELI